MIETEFDIGGLNLAALDNQGAGKLVVGLHGYLDNAESLRLLALTFNRIALLQLTSRVMVARLTVHKAHIIIKSTTCKTFMPL